MTASHGQYLKIPFVWEPGCPIPNPVSRLRFRTADVDWLAGAVASVLVTSPDPADQLAVNQYGPPQTATILLSSSEPYFENRPEWWQVAETAAGEPIGFVLPAVFGPGSKACAGQGTIYYMGVLPEHRGHGFGHELLAQATRVLLEVGVERILCDTAACNAPMIAAFRAAGYIEKEPWERPLQQPPPTSGDAGIPDFSG